MSRPASHDLLFVSWAPHCSRSDSIARRLGGTSHMIYASRWGSRYSTIAFKYGAQTCRTLRLLAARRPRAIFVMTPPVIACFPVWIYAKLTKARYVIDAHTAAFVDPRWRVLRFLHRFFSRQAVTTTVTNHHLQDVVYGWGATSHIIRDVPIWFPAPEVVALKGDRNMAFICSFTKDEPLDAFLEAARRLADIRFYVTGDFKNASSTILSDAPNNVEFTGFLSDARYAGLLLASDAVICLTTLDHTMQRGAYEAVYLEKPVITSNFPVLREAFSKGAVHVDNTVDDIVRGIQQMRDNLPTYAREVRQLAVEKRVDWEKTAAELRRLL